MEEGELVIWDGKHMWIWNVPNTNSGDVFAIIDQAKRMGLTGVLVKAHEGQLPSGNGGQSKFYEDFLRVLPHLKAAGLKVIAWGYNYFEDPGAEAEMILKVINAGADGYCFDAEAEMECNPEDGETEEAAAQRRVIKHQQADQCVKAVREARPGFPLMYSTFPVIRLHQRFPYKIFDAYCDAFLPQVYWAAIEWLRMEDGSLVEATPTAVLAEVPKGYSLLGLTKPVAPVGQAYDAATGAEIKEFADLCNSGGMGYSFWVWEEATPEQIQAITEIAKPPGSPTTNDSGAGNTDPFTPVSDDVVAALKAENAILKAKIAKVQEALAWKGESS